VIPAKVPPPGAVAGGKFRRIIDEDRLGHGGSKIRTKRGGDKGKNEEGETR
jgi:hypothetical protein